MAKKKRNRLLRAIGRAIVRFFKWVTYTPEPKISPGLARWITRRATKAALEDIDKNTRARMHFVDYLAWQDREARKLHKKIQARNKQLTPAMEAELNHLMKTERLKELFKELDRLQRKKAREAKQAKK